MYLIKLTLIHIFIIGINGEATLLAIRPTTVNTVILPLNELGQVDRPVITTFKRYAPVVYDYHFSDGAVIGSTPEHPFYSVDRQTYIPVSGLQPGEQVMTVGQKVVKFIAGMKRDKGEPVYNFEVWREHNYYVSGKDGGEWMLVHNTCPLKLIQDAILKLELLGFKINGKLSIPQNWIYNKVEDGARYVHPTNPKIQIRVHEKGKKPQYSHNYEKPYARYELGKDANNNMRHADIDGNMVDLNDPNYYEKTHIIIEDLTKFE